MPRALRLQFEGAIYHVISRGVNGSPIYSSSEDHYFFLHQLDKFSLKFHVDIYSYCLMKNHFHFLLETKKANLSIFMRRLLANYAMYFNRKHKRTGHLFEGRYKAYLIEKDNHFLEVSRYIHLNPCRAGLVDLPEQYLWSSMRGFLTRRKMSCLNKTLILKQFKNANKYREFVYDGIRYSNSKELQNKKARKNGAFRLGV